MAKPQLSRRAKYSKEVEEIRRMRDLNKILKAGDVENALLSNSAKDSETMNDNVLDNLLDNANNVNRSTGKGLELIERLTTGTASRARVYSTKPTPKKGMKARPKAAPRRNPTARVKTKSKSAKKSKKR